MITLEVTCRDKSYQRPVQWLTTRGTREMQHLSGETLFIQKEKGKIQTIKTFNSSVKLDRSP